MGLTTGDWEGLILVFLGVYVGLALIAVGAGILLLAGILAGIRFLLIRTEPEAPL